MILDLGCHRAADIPTFKFPRSEGHGHQSDPITYRVWVLDPGLNANSELSCRVSPPKAVAQGFSWEQNYQEPFITWSAWAGAICIELDRHSVCVTDGRFGQQSVTIRISANQVLLVQFEFRPTDNKSLIAVDLGNNAAACARQMGGGFQPISLYTEQAEGVNHLPSYLYGLAFLFPARRMLADFALKAQEYAERWLDEKKMVDQGARPALLGQHQGLFDKEPGAQLVDEAALKRYRDACTRLGKQAQHEFWEAMAANAARVFAPAIQPPQYLDDSITFLCADEYRRLAEFRSDQSKIGWTIGTNVRAVASLRVDDFKGRIGLNDAMVESQRLYFGLAGSDQCTELSYASDRYQNPITLFLTRLLLKAECPYTCLYTLPACKVVVKAKHNTTLHNFLSGAIRLIHPGGKITGQTLDEGDASWTFYAAQIQANVPQQVPVEARVNMVRLTVIEMGAGHLHIRVGDVNLAMRQGGTIIFDAQSATCTIAGEYVTLGAYYHRMKPGKIEGQSPRADLIRLFWGLEELKLGVPQSSGGLANPRLFLPGYRDLTRDVYLQEIERPVQQVLRNVFFVGLPNNQRLQWYMDNFASREELERAILFGYRHAMAEHAVDQVFGAPQTRTVNEPYLGWLADYFCCESRPGDEMPLHEWTRDDADGGLVKFETVLGTFRDGGPGVPDVMVIRFSGRASHSAHLFEWADLLVGNVLGETWVRQPQATRAIPGFAVPNIGDGHVYCQANMNRYVVLCPADVDMAKRAVSIGALCMTTSAPADGPAAVPA